MGGLQIEQNRTQILETGETGYGHIGTCDLCAGVDSKRKGKIVQQILNNGTPRGGSRGGKGKKGEGKRLSRNAAVQPNAAMDDEQPV